MTREIVLYPTGHSKKPHILATEIWDDGSEAHFVDPTGRLKKLIKQICKLLDEGKTTPAAEC